MAARKSKASKTRKMHQTTVRFSTELWAELEREAREAGVSAAQYVREAALIRIVYDAERRGERQFEAALTRATSTSEVQQARAMARRGDEEREGSVARQEQGRLVRRRAQHRRERAERGGRTQPS
jgi:hypothetical protein